MNGIKRIKKNDDDSKQDETLLWFGKGKQSYTLVLYFSASTVNIKY